MGKLEGRMISLTWKKKENENGGVKNILCNFPCLPERLEDGYED